MLIDLIEKSNEECENLKSYYQTLYIMANYLQTPKMAGL